MSVVIDVELADAGVAKGELLPVRISHPQAYKYRQLQMDIFDAGVANPSLRLSFGIAPTKLGNGLAQVEIDSKHLPLGIYEIGLMRFHDPIDSSQPRQLDFVARKDYSRKVFEVVEGARATRTSAAVLEEVQQFETQLESEFLSPVDIRKADSRSASEYCVFVFIRDVLVGTPVRFKHFELVPSHSGLDSRDSLNFVNWFLHERTTTGLRFNYDDELLRSSRQSNPVCIVHFPTLISSSFEESRDYCVEETGKLLLALSLSRDAGGVAFEVVVLDRRLSKSTKFSISSQYVGNLLVGPLSGESAQTLETYLSRLACDSMNRFLVGLYRDARRDRNPDFQYVRYWQILEIMAESNNYDPNEPLLDFDSNVMMDGNQPRQSKGSVNIVFRLLRDTGIGTTDETWNKVNVWFAFRSAVAHHGSVIRHSYLSRENVRAWAKFGHDEIAKTPGHDPFLWNLKEDTKLLLMRRLVESAASA